MVYGLCPYIFRRKEDITNENFKKFVAVLLGVVMACVFATSAFAADFSNADTAAKAKAEIKAFAASYGITTIDNTVNSLTADQLQVIYNNMDALKVPPLPPMPPSRAPRMLPLPPRPPMMLLLR